MRLTIFLFLIFLPLKGFCEPTLYNPFYVSLSFSSKYYVLYSKGVKVVSFHFDHKPYISSIIETAKKEHRYIAVDLDKMMELGVEKIQETDLNRTSFVYLSKEAIVHNFATYAVDNVECTKNSKRGCAGKFRFGNDTQVVSATYTQYLNSLLYVLDDEDYIKVDLDVLNDQYRYDSFYLGNEVFIPTPKPAFTSH